MKLEFINLQCTKSPFSSARQPVVISNKQASCCSHKREGTQDCFVYFQKNLILICEPQTFKFCTSVLSLSLFSYSITLFFNWLESQRLFFSLLPMRRVKSVVHLGKGLSVSYLVAWVKVFKRQYLHQYSFDNTTQLLLLTARVW